jgi:hypothetical protein
MLFAQSGCDPGCRGFESRQPPDRWEGILALPPFGFAEELAALSEDKPDAMLIAPSSLCAPSILVNFEHARHFMSGKAAKYSRTTVSAESLIAKPLL